MTDSETFDQFFARFNSKAMRLQYTDAQLKLDLHHKLNDKYRKRIGNMSIADYTSFVRELRKLKTTFDIEAVHNRNST